MQLFFTSTRYNQLIWMNSARGTLNTSYGIHIDLLTMSVLNSRKEQNETSKLQFFFNPSAEMELRCCFIHLVADWFQYPDWSRECRDSVKPISAR